jgi:DNA-binding protein YbaB
MNLLQSKAYVMQLAKAIAADGVIDKNELQRIYEVMAAFELGADSRAEILDLLFFNQKKLSKIEIDPDILDDEELRLSLAKDILFIKSQVENKATEAVAKKILKRLNVKAKHLDFLSEWVSWENTVLKKLGAGEVELADEKEINELASRAAALGVPLTALYYVGTVGLSASGITSGLAALGSVTGITLLGLNPMTAGIAALIIGGISVKKICDFALKVGKKKDIEKALHKAKSIEKKYREYLLHDMTEFEKSTISEWLSGRNSKRKKAIESFRALLSESIQQEISE